MNLSKITLLSILLAVFIIIAGFFAFQGWQVKGELARQIEENEKSMKEINKLQTEIEDLKTSRPMGDETIEDKKLEVTISTNKTEYEQGEIVKIVIKNNGPKNLYIYAGDYTNLTLQRYENGKWITIDAFGPRVCPCGLLCEAPSIVPFIVGEKLEIRWNQIIEWCEDEIKKEKKASLGKYKFIFVDRFYSNEFIIK